MSDFQDFEQLKKYGDALKAQKRLKEKMAKISKVEGFDQKLKIFKFINKDFKPK